MKTIPRHIKAYLLQAKTTKKIFRENRKRKKKKPQLAVVLTELRQESSEPMVWRKQPCMSLAV